MKTNTIEPMTVEEQHEDTSNEKIYTFRKLNSTDTFLMFKIIGKIGINEFTECFGKDTVKQMIQKFTGGKPDNNEGVTIVGISVILEIANTIFNNLPKCESEIYQMLSNTSNMTVNQIKELDFAVFTEMVIDFIKKEEFKDFIKVVSRLFKSVN